MVTVYSTPTCGFCHMAMAYLKSRNIEFISKDISADEASYQEAVGKMHGMFTGVPIIDIDGLIILGFDRAKIDAALREKKLI